MTRRGALGTLWLAVLALACAGDPESPEAQVRRVLTAVEEAAEAGELKTLKNHVSERYQDPQGHDRQSLMAFLTLQVMRQGNRQAVLNIQDISMRSDSRAEVSLGAALASRGSAMGLRASVYHVDLDLEKESDGEWRLVWAQWWPGDASEML
ncbi:MAG: hypothetical protein QNK05_22385 [Myxococcota bacterium]|nr:hypothetical protein [Myxococcota bacterium]